LRRPWRPRALTRAAPPAARCARGASEPRRAGTRSSDACLQARTAGYGAAAAWETEGEGAMKCARCAARRHVTACRLHA
jgi:hypothetical protein